MEDSRPGRRSDDGCRTGGSWAASLRALLARRKGAGLASPSPPTLSAQGFALSGVCGSACVCVSDFSRFVLSACPYNPVVDSCHSELRDVPAELGGGTRIKRAEIEL